MLKIIFALTAVLVFFAGLPHAESLLLTAKPAGNSSSPGKDLAIVGNLQDSSGSPVSDANILAGMPGGSVQTVTNSSGSFEINLPSLDSGVYSVGIVASKNGYNTTSTTIKITVSDKDAESSSTEITPVVPNGSQNIPKTIANFSSSVGEGIRMNPISEVLLKQIEKFKKQYESKEQLRERQEEIQKKSSSCKTGFGK